ncbi:ABC transporter ATP-binding protein/permease [Jatrophihabitans telluris]|uniref:ABC transporter ATP-binding protein/permease n=1 Tax=Jatrophihabitans telluris TaxID=2038343 RepID=A0ABY4QX86_9ACTN|nr:ABC transporter ATP-binding protein [Jatrophihabitans telluris]UQX87872.1 ABC transporter ATP-binding protein/permease [Jatrophihabitans telluris]
MPDPGSDSGPQHGGLTRILQLPRVMRFALSTTWSAAPVLLLTTVLLQLVSAATLVVQLLAGRRLLSGLLKNEESLSRLTPILVVLLVAFAVASMIAVSTSGLQHLLSERVSEYSMRRVLEAATTTELLDFESAELHNRLQRALMNAGSRPTQMTLGLVNVLSSLASSAALSIALIYLSAPLFAVAVVGSIPIWFLGLNASRALYDFAVRQTEPDRQRMYVQLLLTSRDQAKEVRAYLLGPVMLRRWRKLYSERIADLSSILRARVVRGLVGVLLTTAVLGLTLGVIVWMITHHRLSLSSAAAATAGLLLLSRQLQGLSSGVTSLYESALFMQDFQEFASRPEAVSGRHRWRSSRPAVSSPGAAPRLLPFDRLDVEDVSFRYPAGGRDALEHVSLQLRAGEVIALVGANGSGKSTLAKLIAGLYPPTGGTVRWNGHPYDVLDGDQVRAQLAVLFQDFIKFQFSVYENIALGRPGEHLLGNEDAVDRAADAAGAAELIARLPQGLQTQLGPQFVGGSELSGGQWQRIALARAAYRDSPVVILDEPTAALDPIAEASLFSHSRSIFRGKSVVLISHRFGSVRQADRIYVLNNGRIVEQGTHEQLTALNGEYATMYEAQRSSLIGDGASGL